MNKKFRMLVYMLDRPVSRIVGCGVRLQTRRTEAVHLGQRARTASSVPNEQQLPQDQWYISQAIKRFEEANPGVTIELVVQSDAFAALQTYATAGLAGNAPDIANLWSGQFVFPNAEVIVPINDMIPAEDKEKILGWNTTTLDFKEGNPILGYPDAG